MVTMLYETLSLAEKGTGKGIWGRGITAYALARNYGISQRKASKFLYELVAYNFMWCQSRQYANRVAVKFYLNDFGHSLLMLYRHAADNESPYGQIPLPIKEDL